MKQNETNILKEVRKALGISQKDLSERIGISRGQVGNIEQGTRNITERIKKDLVTYLDVNPEWLETGKGNIIEDKYKAYDLSEKEKEFLELYNKLTEEGQETICKTMKMFSKN